MRVTRPLLSACSLTPLAACLASLLVPGTLALAATTWTVDDCGDASAGSGNAGSLRYAAANAASGDTVNIVCSTISLTTGAVTFAQQDITINGPAPAHAVIAAVSPPANGNIVEHTGGGYLKMNYITAQYGAKTNAAGNAFGGCVYSSGNVYLDHVTLYKCSAHSSSAAGYAMGGGVFATGALSITNSVVSHNTATSDLSESVGGGAFGGGDATVGKTTIEANSAVGAKGYGGGLYVTGNFSAVTISDSTVSGNTASFVVGGVSIYNPTVADATVSIANSTISGNSAGERIGGLYAIAATVKLISSTITNNYAVQETDPRFTGDNYRAPGVALFADKRSMVVYLQSTLIANNTYGPSATDDDLSTAIRKLPPYTLTFDAGSANNLVRASLRAAPPAGTITGVCPLLGPLRNNGGSTRTVALLSGSRGIDEGNNLANLTYDQRGTPYARVSGASADIGAYELQHDEIVFDAGFDGCP